MPWLLTLLNLPLVSYIINPFVLPLSKAQFFQSLTLQIPVPSETSLPSNSLERLQSLPSFIIVPLPLLKPKKIFKMFSSLQYISTSI